MTLGPRYGATRRRFLLNARFDLVLDLRWQAGQGK
jgi:hypothetical protein